MATTGPPLMCGVGATAWCCRHTTGQRFLGAGANERLKSRMFLEVPPPPENVPAHAKRVFGVGRDISLEEVDRLILLPQQRAHKSLHRDKIVLGIELGGPARARADRMRAVPETGPCDDGGDQHLVAQVEDGALWRRRQ